MLTILRDLVVFDAYVWLLTDPVTVAGATPLADIPLHGGLSGAHQGEERHVSQSLDRSAAAGLIRRAPAQHISWRPGTKQSVALCAEPVRN
ncbi:MAG TPA: hypothetical protein VF940_07925 [Streptosporangiaceae bacterium]